MADFLGRFRKVRSDGSNALDTWLGRGEDEDAIWRGLTPGPSVDAVSTRLSTLPGAFFAEEADMIAIAGDLQLDSSDPTVSDVLRTAVATSAGRRAAATALWIWASEDVVEPFTPPLALAHAGRVVSALAWRLAPIVDPADWLVDAQRREEAVRLLLLWGGQLPAGEDAATARALWDRLDSLKHNSALQSALADHQHRLAVLAQLKAKTAAEAAARYTHE